MELNTDITESNWTIVNHGDELEKNSAEFIQTFLQHYEKTWSIFIGHAGNGQMANMYVNISDGTEIPKQIQEIRIQFAEHHYTILESLCCLRRINDMLKNAVGSFEDYMDMQNYLAAIGTHLGRIHDNSESCFVILKYNVKDSSVYMERIKEFYYKRHIFVHGKKIPFQIDELGLYLIPELRRAKGSLEGWDRDMSWEDANGSTYNYLFDFLETQLKDLYIIINDFMGSWYNKVQLLIKENNLVMDSPPEKSEGRSGYKGPLSGSTEQNS
jgi:hypothetical protein